jgi:lipid-A-disaccharide synthase
VRVFLSTADASGDMHAAGLVAELRALLDERGEPLYAFGLGGEALEREGFRALVQQSDLAVAGLVEVVVHAPRMAAGYLRLRRALRDEGPDLAIFVDTPDLNLPLAAVARRAGIPVFYYVAPQVWAWRTGRVRTLRKRADRVGVIFPFEEALLREAGVPASFVGHPLVDRFAAFRADLDLDAAARELELLRDRPIVGLLPGSRRNEIEGNLAGMLEAADILRGAIPEVQVCLLLAPTIHEPPEPVPDWIPVIRGRTHEAIALSTVVLAAPGTVTVEAALLGTPLLVTHRANRLSFEIARRISRVPSSCMVNLIADQGVVSERLQELARPAALAGELARLIRDPAACEDLRKALGDAAARLGGPGASRRAAELALEAAGRP